MTVYLFTHAIKEFNIFVCCYLSMVWLFDFGAKAKTISSRFVSAFMPKKTKEKTSVAAGFPISINLKLKLPVLIEQSVAASCVEKKLLSSAQDRKLWRSLCKSVGTPTA